eukprot:gene30704-35729_t
MLARKRPSPHPHPPTNTPSPTDSISHKSAASSPALTSDSPTSQTIPSSEPSNSLPATNRSDSPGYSQRLADHLHAIASWPFQQDGAVGVVTASDSITRSIIKAIPNRVVALKFVELVISPASVPKLITITPKRDVAPKFVELVMAIAKREEPCHACIFYRNEPVPEGWGQKGFYGPPYGSTPEPEGKPVIKKGDLCHITGSKEFFIAKGVHEEWTGSFTVFGHVEEEDAASWKTIMSVPEEPFSEMKGDFTTRWLTAEAKVKFDINFNVLPATFPFAASSSLPKMPSPPSPALDSSGCRRYKSGLQEIHVYLRTSAQLKCGSGSHMPLIVSKVEAAADSGGTVPPPPPNQNIPPFPPNIEDLGDCTNGVCPTSSCGASGLGSSESSCPGNGCPSCSDYACYQFNTSCSQKCLGYIYSAEASCSSFVGSVCLTTKVALGNPPELSSWINSTNPCSWLSVTCTAGVVTALNLTGLPSTGASTPIPPVLGELTTLTSLTLGNSVLLTGVLPPEWASLTDLLELNVSDSYVSGAIPTAWSSLTAIRSFTLTRSIDMSNNSLTSSLPPAWSSLSNLGVLDLAGNSLTSSLPRAWSSLSNLGVLDLAGNSLTSSLPPAWSSLSNLSVLDLAGNSPPCVVQPVKPERVGPSWQQSNKQPPPCVVHPVQPGRVGPSWQQSIRKHST